MTVKLFGIEFADEAERDHALLELRRNLRRIDEAEHRAYLEGARRMREGRTANACTCPCINCSNQAHWMCHGEGVEIDTQQT